MASEREFRKHNTRTDSAPEGGRLARGTERVGESLLNKCRKMKNTSSSVQYPTLSSSSSERLALAVHIAFTMISNPIFMRSQMAWQLFLLRLTQIIY